MTTVTIGVAVGIAIYEVVAWKKRSESPKS